MKRVVPLIMAVITFIISVAPVSAAEPNAIAQQYIIDLLGNAVLYYINGGVPQDSTSFTTHDSGVLYTWELSTSSRFTDVIITLSSSEKPVAVRFNDITGTLITSNGVYYQYKFDVDSSINSAKVAISFANATTTKNLSIVSVKGYTVNYQIMNNIRLNFWGQSFPSETYDSRNLPYNFYITRSRGDYAGTPWCNLNVSFKLPWDAPDFAVFEYYTAILYPSGQAYDTVQSTPSVYIYDGTTLKYYVNSISEKVSTTNRPIRLGNHQESASFLHQLSVDLSGYDLTTLSEPRICLQFIQEGARFSADDDGMYAYGINFVNAVCGVYPDSGGWWRNLGRLISEKFDAILGNIGQKDDANDFNDKVDDNNQKLDDASKDLAGVNRPAVPDNIGSGIDDHLGDAGMVGNILVVPLSSPHLGSLFLIAMVLALMGYVFFGKR